MFHGALLLYASGMHIYAYLSYDIVADTVATPGDCPSIRMTGLGRQCSAYMFFFVRPIRFDFDNRC